MSKHDERYRQENTQPSHTDPENIWTDIISVIESLHFVQTSTGFTWFSAVIIDSIRPECHFIVQLCYQTLYVAHVEIKSFYCSYHIVLFDADQSFLPHFIPSYSAALSICELDGNSSVSPAAAASACASTSTTSSATREANILGTKSNRAPICSWVPGFYESKTVEEKIH